METADSLNKNGAQCVIYLRDVITSDLWMQQRNIFFEEHHHDSELLGNVSKSDDDFVFHLLEVHAKFCIRPSYQISSNDVDISKSNSADSNCLQVSTCVTMDVPSSPGTSDLVEEKPSLTIYEDVPMVEGRVPVTPSDNSEQAPEELESLSFGQPLVNLESPDESHDDVFDSMSEGVNEETSEIATEASDSVNLAPPLVNPKSPDLFLDCISRDDYEPEERGEENYSDLFGKQRKTPRIVLRKLDLRNLSSKCRSCHRVMVDNCLYLESRHGLLKCDTCLKEDSCDDDPQTEEETPEVAIQRKDSVQDPRASINIVSESSSSSMVVPCGDDGTCNKNPTLLQGQSIDEQAIAPEVATPRRDSRASNIANDSCSSSMFEHRVDDGTCDKNPTFLQGQTTTHTDVPVITSEVTNPRRDSAHDPTASNIPSESSSSGSDDITNPISLQGQRITHTDEPVVTPQVANPIRDSAQDPEGDGALPSCSSTGSEVPGKEALDIIEVKFECDTENPFICKLCFESFTMESDIIAHVQTHMLGEGGGCVTEGSGPVQHTGEVIPTNVTAPRSVLSTSVITPRRVRAQVQKATDRSWWSSSSSEESDDPDSDYFPDERTSFQSSKKNKKIDREPRPSSLVEKHGDEVSIGEKGEKELLLARQDSPNPNVNTHPDDSGDPGDPDERLYVCHRCSASFTEPNDLHAHIRNHRDRPFKCTTCPKAYFEKRHLDNHTRTHSGEKPFKCDKCPKAFIRSETLQQHLITHSSEKPFKCDQCSKGYYTNQGLKAHIRKHDAKKTFICHICAKSFAVESYLTRHLTTHTGLKPFKCTECDKAYLRNTDLVIHMRTHTGERPAKCTVCGKGFYCRKALISHMRSHSTKRQVLKCRLCSKSYNHPASLSMHMRTHTGERAFECEVCDMAFTQKPHLQSHTRIMHTGEKPFKCDVCSKAFARKDYLNHHMKMHTTEGPTQVEKTVEN